MPSFNSTSKALSRLVSHRNLSPSRLLKCSDYNKIRCFYSVAGAGASSCSNKKQMASYLPEFRISNNTVMIQKRGFLGCGDGEEGNMLSKVYEERRVLGYSPEQLYAVVAAVDLYEDFLPWCQRSEIIRRHPDGSLDAELEIGFKFLNESYVSHVELNKSKSVKDGCAGQSYGQVKRRAKSFRDNTHPLDCYEPIDTKDISNIHDASKLRQLHPKVAFLIIVWEFNLGPVPGTCNLYFLVDFKFQSPLYRQMANMFFNEVVSHLVGSFNDRCHLIYGPGIPVHESTYEQRA